MASKSFEGIIVGGGIIGTAVCMTLAKRTNASLALLEAEPELALHQTSRNSGVIHSGLYYRPGSLKARTCVRGREALYRFCQEHGIEHERCGKIVVASEKSELGALKRLWKRGEANGLSGLKFLTKEEIRDYEPNAQGEAALYVPQTGIVDFKQVAEKFAQEARRYGAVIITSSKVFGFQRKGESFLIESTSGTYQCRFLVNTAGLYSDRIAKLCGLESPVRIIPFRGEYYELVAERRALVRNLIYPVPDPRFPFLGVHFTRLIDGRVEAGPNAVLSLKRTGYSKFSFSFKDTFQTLAFPGFWRLAVRYFGTGLKEFCRSLSKSKFTKALQRLVPEVRKEDLVEAPSGVRAQAVDRGGFLLDDFKLIVEEGMVHVLNAPSPAATACLAIAETIANTVIRKAGLKSLSLPLLEELLGS